jgi:hypothetical protein
VKNVKHDSIVWSRHDTAEGTSGSHVVLKSS